MSAKLEMDGRVVAADVYTMDGKIYPWVDWSNGHEIFRATVDAAVSPPDVFAPGHATFDLRVDDRKNRQLKLRLVGFQPALPGVQEAA